MNLSQDPVKASRRGEGKATAKDKPVAVADAVEKKTTIDEAIEEHFEDKRQQNLAESTLYKLDNIFRMQRGEFCRGYTITYPEELTLAKL